MVIREDDAALHCAKCGHLLYHHEKWGGGLGPCRYPGCRCRSWLAPRSEYPVIRDDSTR